MSLGGVPICKQDKNHRIIVGGKTPVLQLVRFIQLNQRLSYKKKKKKSMSVEKYGSSLGSQVQPIRQSTLL